MLILVLASSEVISGTDLGSGFKLWSSKYRADVADMPLDGTQWRFFLPHDIAPFLATSLYSKQAFII
jgi:hypothetical protein